MSSPESPSSSHPARAAGFALIGVALVALVIGVVTLFSGGGDDTASGPSDQPSTGAPSESTSAPAPASSTEPPASSAPPTTTSETPPPATTTTAPPETPPTTPAGQQAVEKPPVRVYNNSTISGLAAKATEDVKRSGWNVVDTGNYSQGQIPTTTVYYRPGTPEEESAKALANVMQARVEARFDGIQAAHDGIIVIVTNDYKGPQNVK
ncbi:LytR C-terminal domain-containing protein [Umezawaea tangerina]|uniref:LytR cell envelope-related transcriptional attenuator n=1 Tax=Umezawaea tangerina TaxID=84725 RepID=A0A2T0TL31_9PSEU|nr:LytR C-terminal domain-containing protein [Umezawaea tangerina]PRY46359.1 LytR cell envelope-related transcriptional attenuator [Umezawaea tangerina]